jgi:CheY-like chemotaxis protein
MGLDQKVILTIDDDIDMLDAISHTLESHGYKMLTACNGNEALKLLESLNDDQLPDLILLDYNMPVLNGYEFNLARLEIPRLANIPLVLLTARGDLSPLMDNIEAEAYVNKPIREESILQLANNFIYRRDNARFSFLV